LSRPGIGEDGGEGLAQLVRERDRQLADDGDPPEMRDCRRCSWSSASAFGAP
jgi:hypothetical protein